MPKPTTSSGQMSSPMPDEDLAIGQRVRDLANQVLEQSQVDTEAVADIVRAATGQRAAPAQVNDAEASDVFADGVWELDEALVSSANATHAALQQLASRGKGFTTNDLKEALAGLKGLEEDYVAAASRIAEAMSGNLRREMTELAGHAQTVGAEASPRVAGIMGEFASRVGQGATSDLQTMRGTGIYMTPLASGMLAGVADALRDRSQTRKET